MLIMPILAQCWKSDHLLTWTQRFPGVEMLSGEPDVLRISWEHHASKHILRHVLKRAFS